MMEAEKIECQDEKIIKINLDCGDFLENLVTKCEVQSYPEMYNKLLDKRGDIIRCNDLFDQDPKKSLDKLESTILNIPDVILVYLFDPRLINTKNDDPNKSFHKIPYLTNEKGLSRIIFNYRREHYLGQEISLEGLCELWNIKSEQKQKLIAIIDHLIQKKQIYANWKNTPNSGTNEISQKLVFKKISEVPEKRKQIGQLFLSILFIISALIIFIVFFAEKHI